MIEQSIFLRQLFCCHWSRKRKPGKIFLHMISTVLVIITLMLPTARGECRRQDTRQCEAICVPVATEGNVMKNNSTSVSTQLETNQWKCELRIIVILPANTSIEASSPRVHPVLLKAEDYIRAQQIIPSSVAIRWIFYDDKCDQARATVSAMDGTGRDCGHVILGPACDLSLGKQINFRFNERGIVNGLY